MVKNGKGIWLYIDKLNGPRIWYFYKRWPVDLEKQLGKFDRQSLRTADDREAEIRAVECLRIHEAKINAVRGGQPFHDLSKAMSLADLSEDDRYLLEKVINEAEDSDQPINIPVKISQHTSLLLEYNNIQNGKYDNQLMSYFLARNVILSSDSEVYRYALSQLREGLRATLGHITKTSDLMRIEAIDPHDAEAFETTYFEKPVEKLARPMISVMALWQRFKKNNLSDPDRADDRRYREEITRRQNYVKAFVDFLGRDMPVNYVEPEHVINFLNELSKIPSRQNAKERKMTFTQLVASNHGRPKITKAGAIEWWSRLNLIFADGEVEFKKKFGYENPWKGTKKFVKGTDSTKKRTWYTEELEDLFAQPEFTDPSKRDSFFYSTLCALTHGNRLSEFHMRPMSQLKQTPTGTWYIDVEEGKNEGSERFVPLSKTVIDAGILEWIEKNRAAGAEYLFPNEDHTDPDSRKFSREFGKYLQRRKLYNKTRTFHNFRNTFLSFGHDSQLPTDVVDPAMVLKRIAGHAPQDVHQGYIMTFIDTMKRVVDAVNIRGLPYDRFV